MSARPGCPSASTEALLPFKQQCPAYAAAINRSFRFVSCLAGGTNINSERNRLAGRCDVLVATPGRLIDHLENSGLANKLQRIRTLVCAAVLLCRGVLCCAVLCCAVLWSLGAVESRATLVGTWGCGPRWFWAPRRV